MRRLCLKRLLVAAIWLASLPVAAQITQPVTADAIPLSLEECIKIGIHGASAVLKAENADSVSGASLLQAYAQFLPNLVAAANSADNKGTLYSTTATPTLVKATSSSAGYSLNSTLNIFNGLSDLARLKSALHRRSASEYSLLRAKQAIALDVAQSFLSVILDSRLVEIARKNLQESKERERLLEEQTRVGAKNLADLFRQKAQRSADESLFLTAEDKYRTDQILLLQKLRADVTKNYRFVDVQFGKEEANARFGDENVLIKMGLEKRADLRASTEIADATRWDVKKPFSGYLPKLDFQGSMAAASSYLFDQNVNGNYTVPAEQTPLYTQLGSQIQYSIGLYLTWTLFDRLATHEAVQRARVDASNAEIDAADARNQVQADVRVAYSSYKTSIQKLRASGEGLAAAQKAYAVIEGRYEVGSANFIDLVTAQSNLLQAESARAEAQVNFLLQGRSVEFATGDLNVD